MSKPRLLILGAHGQVGRACAQSLSVPLHEACDDILCVGRDRVDLSNADSLHAALSGYKPQIVINAAAYTNVEKAEDEPALADQVNGHAVGLIAEWCRQQGALLVHYSTDYVFNGQARRPYLETDTMAPQSAYGRSKAMGERFIEQVCGDAVVLRTSWVFARHGDNFYKKMLRFANQRDTLRVVDDQTGAPTPADWLAGLALSLALMRATGKPVPTGLFHAASSGQTTWYDYAALTFELAAGSPLLPRKPQLIRAKTADMNFKAQRPAWSVLDTTRLQTTLGVTPPDWASAVTQALLEDITDSRTHHGEHRS